jgi:hypothetical protein
MLRKNRWVSRHGASQALAERRRAEFINQLPDIVCGHRGRDLGEGAAVRALAGKTTLSARREGVRMRPVGVPAKSRPATNALSMSGRDRPGPTRVPQPVDG